MEKVLKTALGEVRAHVRAIVYGTGPQPLDSGPNLDIKGVYSGPKAFSHFLCR